MVKAASSPTKAMSANENVNPSPAEWRRSSKTYAAITSTNQMASQSRKRNAGEISSSGTAGFCFANVHGPRALAHLDDEEDEQNQPQRTHDDVQRQEDRS